MASIRQDLVSDNTRIEIKFEHLSIAKSVIFHQLCFSCLGIHVHASEFIHLEPFSVFTNTLLGEEDRSRGRQVDCCADKRKQ